MQWAVGSGLVKGKSGNLLDSQGTATRAEIAAMLHRFIEKYELVQGKAPGGLMGWIDPKRLQIPKTGDSSVLGLWGISLCTSLAGCLALTTWQIRRRREEEALQIIENRKIQGSGRAQPETSRVSLSFACAVNNCGTSAFRP